MKEINLKWKSLHTIITKYNGSLQGIHMSKLDDYLFSLIEKEGMDFFNSITTNTEFKEIYNDFKKLKKEYDLTVLKEINNRD